MVKVTGKQANSRKCFVCGLDNDSGLKAEFYELEDGQLLAVFKPTNDHQSYEGRLHGGLAATILDETIGRAIMTSERDIWGVTIDFSIRFRKPIPLDEEIRVLARITKKNRRSFEGTGEILTKDGKLAVEGKGKYLKMSLDKITDFSYEGEDWQVVSGENDPESFDL